MKKIIFMTMVCIVTLSGGCKSDDIMTYEGAEYIQFARSFADSVTVTFLNAGGIPEYDYPVLVELVGNPASHDRTFSVEVLDDYTTATSVNYSMPSEFVLPAGAVDGTFAVKFINTPDLSAKELRLTLRIVSSEQLKAGETQNTLLVIRFSDMVKQPAWWDRTITDSFLGLYSEKKHRLFVEVTGVTDLTGANYYEQRSSTLIFKTWLREEAAAGRTVYEADGITQMSVALIGG
jgi:hypothetical protein